MGTASTYGLPVPAAVLREFESLTDAEKFHSGGHRLGGSDSERQSVGIPGHCDVCAVLGHVAAHPNYGCADVGCAITH